MRKRRNLKTPKKVKAFVRNDSLKIILRKYLSNLTNRSFLGPQTIFSEIDPQLNKTIHVAFSPNHRNLVAKEEV